MYRDALVNSQEEDHADECEGENGEFLRKFVHVELQRSSGRLLVLHEAEQSSELASFA